MVTGGGNLEDDQIRVQGLTTSSAIGADYRPDRSGSCCGVRTRSQSLANEMRDAYSIDRRGDGGRPEPGHGCHSITRADAHGNKIVAGVFNAACLVDNRAVL